MVATLVQEGQEFVLKQIFHKIQTVTEVQTLDITADAGTYKLSFEGDETASLAFNDNAAAIDAALEALASIPAGGVVVSGTFPNFIVTFGGFLANTPLPLIVLSTNALTIGSSAGSIAITRTATGAGSVPQYYWVGLSQSLRATLTEAVTLASINEVTGTGYARVKVRADSTDWVAALIGGFWQGTSKTLAFSATGTWSIARSLFLATTQNNDGKIIDVRDLASEFTLTTGQSRSFNLTEMFAAAA